MASHPLQKAGKSMLWAVALFCVTTAIIGLSNSFELSEIMLALIGAFDMVSVVIRSTLTQVLTPDELRGRVGAVNALFIGTSNELGGFESGAVASLIGPVATVVVGGVGSILAVLIVAGI
jgi:MFS family permease